MKYTAKIDVRPTTSAGNTKNILAYVTVVKLPWWKRVLKVKP